MTRNVCEPGWPGDVANRVDTGDARSIELVDLDGATLVIDTDDLEPEVLDISNDADRRENLADLDL